jgi:acyl-CoA reductase-like NAD-dependent aldehyde dehydrogenase
MPTYEQRLLIGGQWTPAGSGKTYECVNPFTGKAATRAAAATVGDVEHLSAPPRMPSANGRL